MLGLHCCAFSSCGERGLLFGAVVRGLLIVMASLVMEHGLQAPGLSSCSTRAQQLWRTGLVAPWHVGSYQARAQTHVPCIGRQILNHCATREAQKACLYIQWTHDQCGVRGAVENQRVTSIVGLLYPRFCICEFNQLRIVWCCSACFSEKNPHISGPAKFSPLFKDQNVQICAF